MNLNSLNSEADRNTQTYSSLSSSSSRNIKPGLSSGRLAAVRLQLGKHNDLPGSFCDFPAAISLYTFTSRFSQLCDYRSNSNPSCTELLAVVRGQPCPPRKRSHAKKQKLGACINLGICLLNTAHDCKKSWVALLAAEVSGQSSLWFNFVHGRPSSTPSPVQQRTIAVLQMIGLRVQQGLESAQPWIQSDSFQLKLVPCLILHPHYAGRGPPAS